MTGYDGTLESGNVENSGDSSTKTTLSLVISAFSKKKISVILILILSLLAQAVAIGFPIFLQKFIDTILSTDGSHYLLLVSAAIVSFVVAEFLINFAKVLHLSRIITFVGIRLHSQLFAHIIRLPVPLFRRLGIGSVSQRFSDIEAAQSACLQAVLAVLSELPFLIAAGVVMIAYSPLLAGVMAVNLLLVAAASLWFQPRIKTAVARQMQLRAEEETGLIESLGGFEQVKTSRLEALMAGRWSERVSAVGAQGLKTSFLYNLLTQTVTAFERIGLLCVLGLSAVAVQRGTMTLGDLMAVNMIAALVIGPVHRIVHQVELLQFTAAAMGRIDELLRLPAERGEPDGGGSGDRVGTLTVTGIAFRHPPGTAPVLESCDAVFRCGRLHALVGSAGAGKSTLLDLIHRLYPPGGGDILIDGAPIAAQPIGHHRGRILYCRQTPHLFDGSVRDNLVWLGAQPEALAGAAAVEDLILPFFPDGLDTRIGNGGATLSGGQRHLVSLVAALLSGRPVILLDEPTAHLDIDATRRLLRHLARVKHGRIVIAATHDPFLVLDADEVLLMKRGRIAERFDGHAGETPDRGASGRAGRRLDLIHRLAARDDGALDSDLVQLMTVMEQTGHAPRTTH
ncbi:peptidase domain-containing ABC transporter [Azospirillum fermentarium]|uniref:peptidase domain-containing ABC transporter n=1 Tax=Azospirillum fermentarium TaxID=1233114 RepID=UPI002226AD92|nr:ABC transporter transmembrane domain-containing protein [Azospirillum fermentarium]